MEPTHAASPDGDHVGQIDDGDGRADGPESAKKVFAFTAPNRPWPPGSAGERGASAAGPQRDWSAALDLVTEAYEAIRMAEERASAAEDYSKQLAQYHSEQLRVADARLAAAEKRADVAEARAREAEDWLVKFHDTIVDGFQKAKTRQ